MNDLKPVAPRRDDIKPGQEPPIITAVASDSFTTHFEVPVAANSSATNVEVPVEGYTIARVLVTGNGTHNCQVVVYGVFRDGKKIAKIEASEPDLSGSIKVELAGLKAIQVNVFNTDEANANKISADVFLQKP